MREKERESARARGKEGEGEGGGGKQEFAAKAAAEKAAEQAAAEEVFVPKAPAKIAAAEKAAAEKAAAEKAAAAEAAAEERRGKAAPIRAWLRETCEINDEEELTEILDLFVDPRYGAKSLKRLFALEETDVDMILDEATISVSTLRLVKQTWREKRPSS